MAHECWIMIVLAVICGLTLFHSTLTPWIDLEQDWTGSLFTSEPFLKTDCRLNIHLKATGGRVTKTGWFWASRFNCDSMAVCVCVMLQAAEVVRNNRTHAWRKLRFLHSCFIAAQLCPTKHTHTHTKAKGNSFLITLSNLEDNVYCKWCIL